VVDQWADPSLRTRSQSAPKAPASVRVWAGLHHIVDPRTGEPVRDVAATWVIAGSAMVADGLATALFFTSPAQTRTLAAAFGADWLRVRSDGSAHWSTTLEGELFS